MAGSPPDFFPVFLLADYQPIKRPIIPGRNSWGEMVFALPFLRRIYIKFLFADKPHTASFSRFPEARPWINFRVADNPP
jgi:hypothetical protein